MAAPVAKATAVKSGTQAEYYDWLVNRPEQVQRLAQEFPCGSQFMLSDGKVLHVLGYTDWEHLILSPLDPTVDVQASVSAKIYIPAEILRRSIRKH